MIVLQFDRNYLRWALLLLRSLARRDARHPVFADTVNLSAPDQALLLRAYPRLTVANQEVAEHDDFRSFMANRKPKVLQSALRRFPRTRWFALLDADLLVRRRLDDLWSCLDHDTTALLRTDGYWRGRFHHHLQVPSGIVMFRREARALIDNWARWTRHTEPIGAIAPGAWFWDQATLVRAWQDTRLPCRALPMRLFANSDLCPNAAIWSANVQDKDAYYQSFQREHARLCAEAGAGPVSSAQPPRRQSG